MLLYFDLDSRRLSVNSVGTTPKCQFFKKGNQQPISFGFVRNNALRSLDGDFTLTFGLKVEPQDVEFVAVCTAFTYDSTTKLYNGVLDLNTVELDDAMTDLDSLDLCTELQYLDDSEGPISSNTLRIRVDREIITGNEGVPTNLPTPDDWLSARAVRYDIVQTLTEEEQERARNNIGIIDPEDIWGPGVTSADIDSDDWLVIVKNGDTFRTPTFKD